MKVFKMNDCDWVCAENEAQAKKFYEKETGFTNEEELGEFVGEVPLTDTMFVNMNDMPVGEWGKTQLFTKNIGGEVWVKVPFNWVIQNEGIKQPCIIASTEY